MEATISISCYILAVVFCFLWIISDEKNKMKEAKHKEEIRECEKSYEKVIDGLCKQMKAKDSRYDSIRNQFDSFIVLVHKHGKKHFSQTHYVDEKYNIKIHYYKTIEEVETFCVLSGVKEKNIELIKHKLPKNIFNGSKKECEEWIKEVKNNLAK